MATFEEFQEQVQEQLKSVEFAAGEVEGIAASLGLAGGVESLGDLAGHAVENNKTPTLLQTVVRSHPGIEVVSALLGTWEGDANLQDDWAETADAANLQECKAHYVLEDEKVSAAEITDKKREIQVKRLLRKISRALTSHPDNRNGQYEIYGHVRAQELLGTGGIASVFRGVDLLSGETVAVKVLKSESAQNGKLVEVLSDASKMTQGLRHPQISSVLKPASRAERPRARTFFVMEWNGKGTLEERIGDESVGLIERQKYALGMCQGLSYAHKRDVIHGDLRPGNVLVNENGEVRLSDFLAARGELSNKDWAEVVKLVVNGYYLAPELSRGHDATVQSDIFSLGRMLFRVFTRKDENLYDVMVPQTFKAELEAHLADFPDLIEMIEKCTALESSERPVSVSEVLAELHRLGGQLGADSDGGVAALRAAGNWSDLLEVQQSTVNSLPPAERVALLEDMANIQEYVLRQDQLALEIWSQAFQSAPTQALEAQLDRLRGDMQSPEAARTVAEAIVGVLGAGLGGEPNETLRLHLKAAHHFHVDVGDGLAAIPLYRGALEIDPTNSSAFEALDEIYGEHEDWAGLVATLEQWHDTRENNEHRIVVLLRIATLQEERLADESAAMDTLLRVRTLDPGHRETFLTLERLHRELLRWQDLAALLEDEISRETEDDRRWMLRFSLGQVHELHLGDAPTAVGLYRQILGDSPDHVDTIRALENLLAQSVEALPVAGLLEPIYRRHESWAKLASTLEVLLTNIAVQDDAWVITLTEIGKLREEESAEAAFDATARIHQGRPRLDQFWIELERLAPLCAEPRWTNVVNLYRDTIQSELAAEAPDQGFIVSLWLQIGRVQDEELIDAMSAIAAYCEVLLISTRHAEALSHLGRLYGDTSQWQELVDILEIQRQVLLEADFMDDALAVLHRIASYRENELGSPQLTIETYRSALEAHGHDPVSVAQLERLSQTAVHVVAVSEILDPHYRGRANWDALLAVLQRRLDLDTVLSSTERADRFVRMAGIAEEKQENLLGAFEYYLRGVEADPDRDEIHFELERVTANTGEWARLVTFYDELLATGAILDPARHLRLLLSVASWYRDQLERLDDAEGRFRQVLTLHPDHPDALDALDDLYSLRHQFTELYEILSCKAVVAESTEEQKTVLFRLARLSDDKLGDLGRAIGSYQKIVGLDERDTDALDGLISIYERQSDHHALLSTLRQRASVETDRPLRISLLKTMGDLARIELKDPETALGAYEEALGLDPNQPREILQALTRLYLDADNLLSWFELLPRCLTHALSDEERVSMHLLAAELADRPAAPHEADATTHYEAILLVAPYHQLALPALETTYEQTGAWDKLQDIYRRQFVAIHVKAATLAESHLGRRALAISHLEHARGLDSKQIQIIDRLIDLHQADGTWDAVIALVEEKMVLLGDDPRQQAKLLQRLAEALEKQGQTAQAIECGLRALGLYSNDTATLVLLTRLAVHQGRVEEMMPLVIDRLSLSADQEMAEPLLAAAEQVRLAAGGMANGQLDVACNSLGKVFGIDSLDDAVALKLMQPIFEVHQAQAAMIAALRGYLKAAGSGAARRRALFDTTAELCEQIGDREQAFEVNTQLFNEQPDIAQTREQMLRIGADLGATGQAIDAIEKRLNQGIDDDTLAVELALMLARYFDGADSESEQLERAITHYSRVRQRAGRHSGALEALDRLYLQHHDWSNLRSVLADRIAIAGDPVERAQLKIRLATLLENQFDDQAEIATLCIDVLRSPLGENHPDRGVGRAMLESLADAVAAPNNPLFFRAAHALREEFARTGEIERLLQLLEWSVSLLLGDDRSGDRHELLVEMAQTADRNDDLDGAVGFVERALRENPNDGELYRELENLTARTESWERLVSFYADLAQADDRLGDELRISLALKTAKLQHDKLEQPNAAVAMYDFTLGIDTENQEALVALEALYTSLGQLDELMQTLSRRAQLVEDPQERRVLLTRVAELAQFELGRFEHAIASYKSILDEFGANQELLSRLETLHESQEQYVELLNVLNLQLDLARDSDAASVPSMLLRMGQLAAEQLQDIEAAANYYTDALDFQDSHDHALQRLAELYRGSLRWQDLIDVLDTHLGRTQNSELKMTLSLTGAHIAEVELGETDTAILLLHAARAADPDHQEATELLYRLLGDTNQWHELRNELEESLNRRSEDPTAQTVIALRIADLALSPDKLGDIDVAQHYLSMVLELDPQNPQAAQLLVRLYLEQENWPEAVDLIGRMIESAADDAEQAGLLIERGDIYLNKLGMHHEAMTDYQSSYQLNAGGERSVERLIANYTEQHAWQDLIQLFELQRDRLESVEQKVRNELAIADLIRSHAVHPDRLIPVLEGALSYQPPYPLNIEVILQVVDAHFEAGSLVRAADHIDAGLLALEDSTDKPVLASLWYYKGLVAAQGSDLQTALEAHQKSFGLDTTHLPNLISLGRLVYSAQQWDQTVKTLQMALLKQTELSNEQKIEVYFMMGTARAQMGDLKRAKDMFKRVLRIDRDHTQSIRALEAL